MGGVGLGLGPTEGTLPIRPPAGNDWEYAIHLGGSSGVRIKKPIAISRATDMTTMTRTGEPQTRKGSSFL